MTPHAEHLVDMPKRPANVAPAVWSKMQAARASSSPAYLLCVDPGLNASGVALFRGDRLVEAACLRPRDGVIETPVKRHAVIGARVAIMARLVVLWCDAAICRSIDDPENPAGSRVAATPDEVAVEWPQIYTRDKSEGDPNDLLPLAGVCAAVVQSFALTASSTCYTPRDWKGTIDGDAMTVRLERRLVDSGEAAFVLEHAETYRHNAVDAYGIGLHHLGRLKPRRVVTR